MPMVVCVQAQMWEDVFFLSVVKHGAFREQLGVFYGFLPLLVYFGSLFHHTPPLLLPKKHPGTRDNVKTHASLISLRIFLQFDGSFSIRLNSCGDNVTKIKIMCLFVPIILCQYIQTDRNFILVGCFCAHLQPCV